MYEKKTTSVLIFHKMAFDVFQCKLEKQAQYLFMFMLFSHLSDVIQ